MMMSMDQWDWKTNAPEFVPGGLPRGLPGPLPGGCPGGYPDGGAVHHPGYAGAFSAPHAYNPGGPAPLPGSGLGLGGLPPPPPPPPVHHGGEYRGPGSLDRGPPLPGAHGAHVPMGMPEEPISQLRAQYEWQIQSKDQKLRDLQNRLSREEVERVQMQADFERDRQGLMMHLNQLVAAVERYGIPVDGQRDDDGRPLPDAAHAAAHTKNRLDSKMEQLNSLLQGREEGSARSSGMGRSSPSAPGAKAGSSSYSAREDAVGAERSEAARRDGSRSALATPGGGSSASRHRVTFPHDIVQPLASARPGAEVERAVRALERRTGNTIDQQARQALEVLGPDGAREALRRAEDLVQGQGGKCSNLSSVLQSVCRKIRRRGLAGSDAPSGTAVPPPPPPQGARQAANASGDVRRRQGATGVSRPSAIDEEDETAPESRLGGHAELGHDMRQDPRVEPRDDPRNAAKKAGERGAAARQPNPWSTTRFDKLSRQGAFELSRGSNGTWDLRICMSELDPPLTDEGMQVYCRWLHQGLQRVREECSLRSLRQISAEVNFSKNGLSDDAVGRLLQALQRSELSVTCLNLHGNCIGPIGAHHVCDFLRGASYPLREVHLSHNKIDDEVASEMLRLLAEHPRYPPRRPRDGGGGEVLVPVWLRLNNNWIRDPAKVLRKAESEPGITVSHSHSRHTGGPTVCGWLHLYRFDVQDVPVQSPEPTEEKGPGRRRERASANPLASAGRLEGSIAEGGPSQALNLRHHTERGEGLGRRVSASSRLGSGPGDVSIGAPPPPPGSPSLQRSVGLLPGSRDGPPASVAAAPAPPGTGPPPPRPPPPADAETAGQEMPSAALPLGRGAPEQTPEPDGQLAGAVAVGVPQRGARGPGLEQADDESEEQEKDVSSKRDKVKAQEEHAEGASLASRSGTPPSPLARPQVRLLVAPKILQRGAPPVVLPPESS